MKKLKEMTKRPFYDINRSVQIRNQFGEKKNLIKALHAKLCQSKLFLNEFEKKKEEKASIQNIDRQRDYLSFWGNN